MRPTASHPDVSARHVYFFHTQSTFRTRSFLPHPIRIMAFTDAILAIICTSCAVPLWANGTRNFNPIRLVPFVTTFFILVRLW